MNDQNNFDFPDKISDTIIAKTKDVFHTFVENVESVTNVESSDLVDNDYVNYEDCDALSEMEFQELIRDLDEDDFDFNDNTSTILYANNNIELDCGQNRENESQESPFDTHMVSSFSDIRNEMIQVEMTLDTLSGYAQDNVVDTDSVTIDHRDKKMLLGDDNNIELDCVQDLENESQESPFDAHIVSSFSDTRNKMIQVESTLDTLSGYAQDNVVDTDSVTIDHRDKKMLKKDWNSIVKLSFKAVNPSSRNSNNYLRGCLWSPDGTCLLTNSNDNIMRIYELPRDGYDQDLYCKEMSGPGEITPVLNIAELDLIYDYCWYPYMDSRRPETCLFACTSRKGAVRLWDAYHGTERAYVQPYDHLVEPVSAHSIAFSRDGFKMYCGFNKCIRVFDISRLSNAPERRPHLGTKSELRGIVSCIATSAVNIGMYGCGSFSKDAAIYHEQTGERILEFLRSDDRIGGITHIEFSPTDINTVATGGRIDHAIHVWDIRSLGSPIYSTAKRDVRTNQRIYFQFDSSGQYIITGNHNGNVSVYNLFGQTRAEDEYLLPKIAEWSAHNDVCNGVSLHPSLPLLATASGQRRLTPPWRRSGMLKSGVIGDCEMATSETDSDWSSDDEQSAVSQVQQNEVRLWSLNMVDDDGDNGK